MSILSSTSGRTLAARLTGQRALLPSRLGARIVGNRRYASVAPNRLAAKPLAVPRRVHVASLSTKAAALEKEGSQKVAETPATTFEDLGLHRPIVASLKAGFPHVQYPTDVQSQFIPAILGGKDVFLRDSTGSGKSFGLVLALLNKPQIVTTQNNRLTRHITSLILVPHRDLAYQYLNWIERMVNANVEGGTEPPPISAIAQVLVRDEGMHLGKGLDRLRESITSSTPPHVLIATPQALLDIHNNDPFFLGQHLSSSTLSAVCVDEADYLIETMARKDPGKAFKKAIEKEKRRLAKHPGPTRELLNLIYRARQEWNGARNSEDLPCPQSPQLILSSATLRVHLRNYVYEESGWLDRRNVVKIYGAEKKEAKEHRQRGLLHSVILVSEERVRNIEGAVEYSPISDLGGEQLATADSDSAPSKENEPAYEFDKEAAQKYAQTPSPFKAHMLEAIATAFAVDVPSAALLVLPASAPVSRAVWELSELGINACSLDLTEKRRIRSSADNPTLLVSTLATTRGVDLPDLSHVFVYGLPHPQKRVNAQTVDAYLHIAGRVGRFGRGGKVVTFVEEAEVIEEDEGEGQKTTAEKDLVLRVLETINVERPAKFAVFD